MSFFTKMCSHLNRLESTFQAQLWQVCYKEIKKCSGFELLYYVLFFIFDKVTVLSELTAKIKHKGEYNA